MSNPTEVRKVYEKAFVLSINHEVRLNVNVLFFVSFFCKRRLKFIQFTVQNCLVVHIDESACYPIYFILFFFEVRGKMMLNVRILTINN